MLALMVLSFFVDFRIIYLLRFNFINRRLAITSWLLDLAIFAGGIWEVIIAVSIGNDGAGVIFLVCGILLIACTFLRVITIVMIILYVIFVLPLYLLPEWCCCR